MQSLVPALLPEFNHQMLSGTQLLLKSSSGKKTASCWLELTGAGKPTKSKACLVETPTGKPLLSCSELLSTSACNCFQLSGKAAGFHGC